MSAVFRILLIVSSILTVIYILFRIHKNQLRIQDSIFWIVFSAVVLLLAFFPQPIVALTSMLGIVSPVNFVFLVFIFVAFIRLFSTTSKISMLENKLKILTYQQALQAKESEDREAKHENA